MTVLSAQTILKRVTRPYLTPWPLEIDPFFPNKQLAYGASYGLTSAGYDIRVGELSSIPSMEYKRLERGDFLLCASMERIKVPIDLQVIVHDKSSWARKGLALQNTVLEPGWEGYITLELSNHGRESLVIHRGQPIAQLIFHKLDAPTCEPYKGKYQNQGRMPTPTIHEEATNEAQVQGTST